MNIKNEVLSELTERIIPFWQRLRDNENGGFYGNVTFDLKVQKDAPKGSILHSRILWFFSECFLEFKKEEYLACAKHAYEFLVKMVDNEFEGVYWAVDFSGKPLETTKYTYPQAFAIYALSSYYKASKDENALALAVDLFNLIETKCRDEFGFNESYDREFNPIKNEHLSENGIIADKTMNTLLHVFEGYAGLYEAAEDAAVKASAANAMRRILSIFKDRVYNEKLMRQDVFFDMEMRPIIDLQSYGHDIESSWLIDWGTGLLNDCELSREIGEITSALAESVMQRAYDKYVWNECENGRDDKTSVWWVQAEAILGFMNHYKKHPEKVEYKKAAEDIWEFIKHNIFDNRKGSEWFEQLDESGKPDTGKPMAGIWKCPYHNGRMCLNVIQRLKA